MGVGGAQSSQYLHSLSNQIYPKKEKDLPKKERDILKFVNIYAKIFFEEWCGKKGEKKSFRAFEDLKIEKFLNHGEGKERGYELLMLIFAWNGTFSAGH